MNAKEEFLGSIRNMEVLCASISYRDCWEHDSSPLNCNLPVNYTEEQYNAFIESLDFDYDSGYGGQELFGTIWYKDGTWSDRGEYDGSEWWQYHVCPEIPKSLTE
jgi:hypothetical protein